MEEARREVFQLFNPAMDIQSWNLIVGSARCDYILQAHYQDTLKVVSWIGHVGNSSFTVEHALQNARDRWVARGQAVLIHFSYATGGAVALPPDIRRTLLGHGEGPEGAPVLR